MAVEAAACLMGRTGTAFETPLAAPFDVAGTVSTGCNVGSGDGGRGVSAARFTDGCLDNATSLAAPPCLRYPPIPKIPMSRLTATIDLGIRSWPLNSASHTGQKRRLVNR